MTDNRTTPDGRYLLFSDNTAWPHPKAVSEVGRRNKKATAIKHIWKKHHTDE